MTSNITITTGKVSTFYEAEGSKMTTEARQMVDGSWIVNMDGRRHQSGPFTRVQAEKVAQDALAIYLTPAECSWCEAPATGTAVAENRVRYNSCGADDHGYNYWD